MGGPPAGRGADPAVVAILNRLVQVQEKRVSDKKDTKHFTQFPSKNFDRTEPGEVTRSLESVYAILELRTP